MDLDTSAKGLSKIKYSPIVKILCILLSFVTFLSAVSITLMGVAAVEFRLDNCLDDASKTPELWTETGHFQNLLYIQVSNIIGDMTSEQRKKALRSELEASRKEVLAKAEQKYLDIASTKKTVHEYYDEEFDEWHDEYTYYEKDTDTSVILNTKTNGGSAHEFQFDVEDLPEDSKKRAERFNSMYDDFAEDIMIAAAYYYEAITDEINIYAKGADGKETNLILNGKEFSEAEALKSDHYIIIENNKIKGFGGMPEHLASGICKSFFEQDKFTSKLYVAIYFNDSDLVTSDFVHSFTDPNSFAILRQLFIDTQSLYDNIVGWAIFDVILLVLSFCFAFLYFSVSGRKNENEPSKLYFCDYVFLELQLAIVGGLGFGACVVAFDASDSIRRGFPIASIILIWAVFAAVCWVLLFGLCTSVAHFIGSDKKFYKHLLTYWILLGLFYVVKFIAKGIAKLARAIGKGVKKGFSRQKGLVALLSYKPTKFKRNLIILTIIYLVANFVLDLFIILTAAYEFGFLTFVLVLLAIVGNVLVLRKVLSYIKNLDTIIAASEHHIDSGLDTSTLDPSLQILNESMRYTNAELQQAINKAVKDERLRTELITNVSHDLKTPLTSIINYVDLMTKCDITDEKALEYLGVLQDKSGKLKRLIEDLIEASKLSSGNITVNLTPLNLTELCLQSSVDVQMDFEAAGLDIILKQGEKPITVIGDGSKTYRVLENLFSNARKYSAKASRVYVSVYDEGDCGIIEIKNISAKPLDISAEELTERFVRGDASRNQEGNGLGLSIAKELCKAQHGELELIIDGDLFKARVKLPKK